MERVARFVQSHRLHNTTPVDLSCIRDLYDVQMLPLSPKVKGFIYLEPDLKLIGVNQFLSPYERRMIIAHEVAHDLLNHTSHICHASGWGHIKTERDAQRGAADILIDRTSLFSALERQAPIWELEDLFRVPAELIRVKVGQLLYGSQLVALAR